MLSVVSSIAGVLLTLPQKGLLVHVLDLDTVEIQRAVAVFTEVLRIQLRGILI